MSLDACICVSMCGSVLCAHVYVCISLLFVGRRASSFLSLGFTFLSSLWADRMVVHLSIPGGK